MRIKNNLSKLMGEKRMTMAEVHRLTGLSHTTIFKIYHDKVAQIGLATIAKLCYALDCSVGELFEYIPD
jgi:putative transcriptional regulator